MSLSVIGNGCVRSISRSLEADLFSAKSRRVDQLIIYDFLLTFDSNCVSVFVLFSSIARFWLKIAPWVH